MSSQVLGSEGHAYGEGKIQVHGQSGPNVHHCATQCLATLCVTLALKKTEAVYILVANRTIIYPEP